MLQGRLGKVLSVDRTASPPSVRIGLMDGRLVLNTPICALRRPPMAAIQKENLATQHNVARTPSKRKSSALGLETSDRKALAKKQAPAKQQPRPSNTVKLAKSVELEMKQEAHLKAGTGTTWRAGDKIWHNGKFGQVVYPMAEKPKLLVNISPAGQKEVEVMKVTRVFDPARSGEGKSARLKMPWRSGNWIGTSAGICEVGDSVQRLGLAGCSGILRSSAPGIVADVHPEATCIALFVEGDGNKVLVNAKELALPFWIDAVRQQENTSVLWKVGQSVQLHKIRGRVTKVLNCGAVVQDAPGTKRMYSSAELQNWNGKKISSFD